MTNLRNWNNCFKFIVLTSICMAMAFAFIGCGTDEDNKGDTGAAGKNKVVVYASDSSEGMVKALTDAYSKDHNDVDFEIKTGNSHDAVEAVRTGGADIGIASRTLESDEKAVVDEVQTIALDGVAVIVNRENKVEDISSEDLTGVYTGKMNGWKDLKGSDSNINIYSREVGSGTRSEFEKKLSIGGDDMRDAAASKIADNTTELKTSDEIKKAVAADKDAVGYISMMALDKTVKAVTLDGVELNNDAVTNGSYGLTREFVMFAADEESESADDFMEYASSADGQKIIEETGYVPVK